jgi:FecR protein
MTRQLVTIAAWLLCGLIAPMSSGADAMPSPLQVERSATNFGADAGLTRLTQAAPAPQASAPDAPAPVDPIGNVATLTGTATVTRNGAAGLPLKLEDDIFKNDVLQTSANSSLGVTFNDETTFNLTANSRIAVDNYVYEDGGSQNAALFNIAKGTVAFVASAVAKTGDMKISTPTATLGIRGTSGLVEVPEGADAATARNHVAIKLYPDPDGRVGHIEVNGRDGTRLGLLSQGASGFTIRPGVGAGARFAAVPLAISPRQVARDQGIVRQVHAAQAVGRQVVTQRRIEIRNNPALRNNPARQPAAPKPNGLPGQPGQPALPGLPKQNGLPKQPALPKQNSLPTQPGLPKQDSLPKQPGLPKQNGLPKQLPNQNGVPKQPDLPKQNSLPKQPGLPKQNGLPKQPGPAQPRQPTLPAQPVQPARPGQPRPPGLQRQGPPLLQRPARQSKPAPPRRPAAAPKRKPREEQR